MSRIKTWEISDEFWALAEPLIPTSLRGNDKEYKRKPGGGTKPKCSNRREFSPKDTHDILLILFE